MKTPQQAYEAGAAAALETYKVANVNAVPKPPPTWAHGTNAKKITIPSMVEMNARG